MIRVLVVAEEAAPIDNTIEALEREDITVVRAHDALVGRRQLAAKSVDAIVSVASLPEMTGLQFLQLATADHPDTPTVLLVDERSTELINHAQAAGIANVLYLDTTMADLLVDCIKRIVFNRRLESGLDDECRFQTAMVDILQELLRASTRTEIEEAVCGGLVRNMPYPIAWMSEYDPEAGELVPRTAVGIDVTRLRSETVPNGEPEAGIYADDCTVRSGTAGEFTEVIVPLWDDDTFYGSLHVYTAQGTVEETERTHLTELADSVARAIAKTTGGREEDRSANASLIDYSGILAHELRNNINVVQAFLELGRERSEQDHFDRAEASLERIERLASDAAIVARQRVNQENLTDRELSEAARAAWGRIDTTQADLVVAESPSIPADQNLLELLLENLFRNAVDHGGDDVTIEVGAAADGFYVQDDGLGIPENERDEVFEWGYSLAGASTGIGLALVKRIADIHDWSIEIVDSPTGGTRFEITEGSG